MKTKKDLRMKKITLLLVAAVFAIGMQSCSTDKDVLIEENVTKEENSIPKNAINVDDLLNGKNSNSKASIGNCFEKILVVYTDNFSEEEYLEKLEQARNNKFGKNKFSSIFSMRTPLYTCAAGSVYEWFVPCNEVPTKICDEHCNEISDFTGSAKVTSGNDHKDEQENSDDDPNCSECEKVNRFYFLENVPSSCEGIFQALGVF